MSVRSFYVTRDAAEALVELIEVEARVQDSTRISYLDLLYHDLRKRFGMMPQELPKSEGPKMDPFASALIGLLDLIEADTEDPAIHKLCKGRFKLAENHGYTVSYFGPGLTSSERQ